MNKKVEEYIDPILIKDGICKSSDDLNRMVKGSKVYVKTNGSFKLKK